ncbi:MAG: helix-turn-helix transcriptional regulator [Pseudomonadota bacterium]
MKDFAAAAMFRLIRLSLDHQGISSMSVDGNGEAHVPFSDKRLLAERLWNTCGPNVIVKVGEAIQYAPPEPILVALSLAQDPVDLVNRWQRLERFVHSRHRVRIEAVGQGWMQLKHFSLVASSPPTAAEDLLIFGLLTVLIEQLGVDNLQARITGEQSWRRTKAVWEPSTWPTEVSTWEFCWSAVEQESTFLSALNSTDNWLDIVRTQLTADPGRDWRVEILAKLLGTSTRTLQRRFTEHHTRFSDLLREARMFHAAQLLTTSGNTPAEIGYLCGFSDQAHFTRAFKRHTALTPANFRIQFESGNTKR